MSIRNDDNDDNEKNNASDIQNCLNFLTICRLDDGYADHLLNLKYKML